MQIHRFRVLVVPERAIQINPNQTPLVYAMLAAAYGLAAKCPSVLPDGVLVEAPEQGRVCVQAGEPFAFGWTMLSVDHRDARLRCQRLVDGLRQLGSKSAHPSKPFNGGFQVSEVRDILSNQLVNREFAFTGIDITDQVNLTEKLDSETVSIDIRLTTPLRIQRPSVARKLVGGQAFMDQAWFCARRWLSSVQERLRDAGLSHLCPSTGHPSADHSSTGQTALADELVDSSKLTWLDLPYQGEGGRKSLGGVVGNFSCAKVPVELLPALFWGQLIGAGRNTSMGLGRYQLLSPSLHLLEDGQPIAEIQQQRLTSTIDRSASLVDYALQVTALDRGAARYELPVAQAITTAAEIRNRTYQPDAPSSFVLRDGDKQPRRMVVPSRRDRAIQVAVLESLAPAVDRYLETSSFAYRRGLGRHTAAKAIQSHSSEGFTWAIRSDIHRFFDSVDHQVLRSRIEAYFPDPPLVELLMTWVHSAARSPTAELKTEARIETEPQINTETDNGEGKGLPTGAPISPVLANLLLDRFDEQVQQSEGRLVRYADDFLILHRTQQAATEALEIAKQAAEELKLMLNQSKTVRHSPEDAFEFLGFRFEQEKDWRFRVLLPPTQLGSLGWTDLNEVRQVSQSDSRDDSIPLFPGERPSRMGSVAPVVILSPRVAKIEGQPGELIVLDRAEQILKRLKCRNLRTLIVQGTPTIDGTAIRQIVEAQVDVLFLASSGQPCWEMRSRTSSVSASLRRAQVDISNPDASDGLEVARLLIAAKLRNTAIAARTLLPVVEGAAVSAALQAASEDCMHAASTAELLGFEGYGAAVWYSQFGGKLPKGFRFEKRVSPRANDPANAMLNVAHTHIHRWCEASAVSCGLLPELGVLHRPRSGHNALASDFQEPFRHLADRAVWAACHELNEADFDVEQNAQYPITIKPKAMRKLFQILYSTLNFQVQTIGGHSGTYRDHIFRQAREFRHWLEHREAKDFVFEQLASTNLK